MKTLNNALRMIGHDIDDIPAHRIEPGRILISVADNGGRAAHRILTKLRHHLPDGVSADWTGSSDTDGDGETTVDPAITWRPTAREILALRATQSGLRYQFRQEADGLWTVTDPRGRDLWTGNLAGVWTISGGGLPA